MTRLLSMASIVPLGACIAACGSGGVARRPRSTASRSSMAAVTQRSMLAAAAGIIPRRSRSTPSKTAWVRSTYQPRLLNDGDHDERGRESQLYHDQDDQTALEFGHAANARDRHALTAVVKTFYAAAVEGNGARACTTMSPPYANAIPVTYGKLGPPYLHEAKTCSQVLSMLFKHMRGQLTAPMHVTNVRVGGKYAFVFFGSTSMPASQISIRRIDGSWQMVHLVGGPML